VSELVQLIKDMGKKVIFAGMLQKCMKNILHRSLETTVKLLREPSSSEASSVARLAYLKAMNNELESCFDMVPFYLRKSQAEREYEKKLCKDC